MGRTKLENRWTAIYIVRGENNIERYPLDREGRHVRKLSRQKRRNLSNLPIEDVPPPPTESESSTFNIPTLRPLIPVQALWHSDPTPSRPRDSFFGPVPRPLLEANPTLSIRPLNLSVHAIASFRPEESVQKSEPNKEVLSVGEPSVQSSVSRFLSLEDLLNK